VETKQEQHRNNVVERNTTIDEIAHIMRCHGIDTVLVVENGVLIGSVTDRDLAIKGLASGLHPRSRTAWDVMTPTPDRCLGESIRRAGLHLPE
jgi:CBS domain-containing protein